ncbi:MAG: exodeoxyribonuclease VII small subunit [Oscillospiraceae bacterium]|jgi:exodeoxyribonuclease VII small subunit|nr:exodeoxyribonuclease VII small subunit [Oscillospiraceae bacterium]
MPTKKPTFEEALARLEVIVARLEQGEVPLEEALGLFEEGTALMKQCSTALDKAEQKVAKLLPGLNGAAVEEPMEEMEL